MGILRRFVIISSVGKRSTAFFGGSRFRFNCFSGTSSDLRDAFDDVLDDIGSGDSIDLCGGVSVVSVNASMGSSVSLGFEIPSDEMLSWSVVVEAAPDKYLFESSRSNKTLHGIT